MHSTAYRKTKNSNVYKTRNKRDRRMDETMASPKVRDQEKE